MGAIDFFFPQQQNGTNTQKWQIPAVLDHLGAGQHKLTLTVSGNHDTASNTGSSAYNSNGNNVYIDCFVVPAPFAASADQQAALTRVASSSDPSDVMRRMGIPPARAMVRAAVRSTLAIRARHPIKIARGDSSPPISTIPAPATRRRSISRIARSSDNTRTVLAPGIRRPARIHSLLDRHPFATRLSTHGVQPQKCLLDSLPGSSILRQDFSAKIPSPDYYSVLLFLKAYSRDFPEAGLPSRYGSWH
jgi:hypothetical protein